VWHGIQSPEPPAAAFDYAEIREMAERMLDTRRNRFPQMVAKGRMSATDAEAQIALFEILAAEWRWMATGEGAPAPADLLPALREALDQSITTIAEIAREQRGFTSELAAQAEWVIAMAWHLEPAAAPAPAAPALSPCASSWPPSRRPAVPRDLHPMACPCRACLPAAGRKPSRFPIPAGPRRWLTAARAHLLAILTADRRLPMSTAQRLAPALFECRCGNQHSAADNQIPVGGPPAPARSGAKTAPAPVSPCAKPPSPARAASASRPGTRPNDRPRPPRPRPRRHAHPRARRHPHILDRVIAGFARCPLEHCLPW
jgi:hypothetical protein